MDPYAKGRQALGVLLSFPCLLAASKSETAGEMRSAEGDR
jgi:hypothetical protein